MTEPEKIEQIIRELGDLRSDLRDCRGAINRVASDQESEKRTRKERNDTFDNFLHGTNDRVGLFTRVDRLEQFTTDLKQDRKERRGIWISILILFVSAIMNWLKHIAQIGN